MIDRSKLALVVVVAAFGFASPAFAQAANSAPHRVLHTGKVAPKNKQVVSHESGLHAFAQAPSLSGTGSFNRYDPSLTGGGSPGYNLMGAQDGSAQTLAH